MKNYDEDMFWDYPIAGNYDFGIFGTCSATDCTGLIPSAPVSDDEFEAYNDVFRFQHQDVPAKDDTLKNPINKL